MMLGSIFLSLNVITVFISDALDAGMIIATIVLAIISSLIIVLIIWQIYYRVKNHRNYKIKRDGTSVDSNAGLTPANEQDMTMSERNSQNASHMSVVSGTTNTTERTEFGLKEFGTQQSSLSDVNRKKDSISEDEGVHVGDMASVSYMDPPVPV
jgi:hypothetical protein